MVRAHRNHIRNANSAMWLTIVKQRQLTWTDSDCRLLPSTSTIAICYYQSANVNTHLLVVCTLNQRHYLPTVILSIIWYSITHSLFHSRLKTFLFCKSFPMQPPIFLHDSLHGFPSLFTVIAHPSLLFSFSVLYFLVVGSVR